MCSKAYHYSTVALKEISSVNNCIYYFKAIHSLRKKKSFGFYKKRKYFSECNQLQLLNHFANILKLIFFSHPLPTRENKKRWIGRKAKS